MTSPRTPLESAFDRAAGRGSAALLPYFVAGFPNVRVFRECLVGAEGADAIEVGVPFSDPIADGPAIRAAAARALRAGMVLPRVLDEVASMRGRIAAPVILMTYLNPAFARGPDRFFAEAAAAGVAGVIVPDLNLEAAASLREMASARGIDLVLLAAPTTSSERMRSLAKATRGFLYLVSRAGTTGVRDRLPRGIREYVARARRCAREAGCPGRPLAVGFGVGSARVARALGRWCDGVVVGSALVPLAERGGRRAVSRFLGKVRRALDSRAEEDGA
jgi:tryptophan synthase alpha chain